MKHKLNIREDEHADFSGMGLITTQASAAAHGSASIVGPASVDSQKIFGKSKNMIFNPMDDNKNYKPTMLSGQSSSILNSDAQWSSE